MEEGAIAHIKQLIYLANGKKSKEEIYEHCKNKN